MKAIATVNFNLPTVEENFSYHSGASLVDFDIVVFGPSFPWFERQHFSNGGSCVSIDSTQQILSSMTHWKREILATANRGSTVFVVLDDLQVEQFATGSSSPRKGEVNYQTQTRTNYDAVPGKLAVRKTRGRKISVRSDVFKPIFDTLTDFLEYRVVLENENLKTSFAARDGSNLGGVASFKESTGHLVLLPYFDFNDLTEEIDGEECWNSEALKLSRAITTHLVEIDKSLKRDLEVTPPPAWAEAYSLPTSADKIQSTILELETRIATIEKDKNREIRTLNEIGNFRSLLFASGKELESAIERTLKLIGYEVEGLRIGDLEIDHIIHSPEGKRMIGEAEGRGNSAIAIAKFRQLESNINEDFQRDEVDEPASGIIFGNGFRLTDPKERKSQFTEKCLTNANRLQTVLIQTPDLYPIAVYLIDNPKDENFKAVCRAAIESSPGNVVVFPDIPTTDAKSPLLDSE